MGRAPCCDRASVRRGPWSPDEDAILKSYIENHGTGGNWITLPQKAGLKRCGKSCRLRWLNYLRPDIRHGGFTEEEDNIICSLYFTIGSRWSVIASNLPGRTDNNVKNYWNTRLKKKLLARRVHSNTNSSIRGNIPYNASNHSPCSITRDAPASTTLPHLRLPDDRQQTMDFFIPTPSLPGLAEFSDTTVRISSSSPEPSSIGSSLGSSSWVVEGPYSGLSIDSLLDLDFGAMLDVLSNGFGSEQETSSEIVPNTNSR